MHVAPVLVAPLAMFSALSFAANSFLEPTLDTHLGPWYRPNAPFVNSLWQPGQAGERLQLSGRVLSTAGLPLTDALVELWHTDTAGNYPPLNASLRSNANGSFAIGTVLPGHNGGYRARHIHFVVTHPGYQRLITRIFFKGDENIAEAPYPELAVFLEQSEVAEKTLYFAEVEFVLKPQ